MMRVAMVGVGGMARSYRKVYAALPNVEWTLAVDVNEEDLAICEGLGARRLSQSFEDALGPDIDMVDISTPNHLHEQQAVAALKADKHVLLQKPMANTLPAADNILRAAASSRGKLGMYMSSYTNPLVWEIRKMIRAGALGMIQSVRARDAHRGGVTAPSNKFNWRGDKTKTGGGSFVQLSIHAINLMQWWLDSPIVEIAAYSDNQYCPNVGGDDVTTAIGRFRNGFLGTFDSGWASDLTTREIYGTRGYLNLCRANSVLEMQLDEPYSSEWINYATPGQLVRINSPRRSLDDPDNPYNQQRMFIERIIAGKVPHMPGEAGRCDLAVVQAAYESAAAHQFIAVN